MQNKTSILHKDCVFPPTKPNRIYEGSLEQAPGVSKVSNRVIDALCFWAFSISKHWKQTQIQTSQSCRRNFFGNCALNAIQRPTFECSPDFAEGRAKLEVRESCPEAMLSRGPRSIVRGTSQTMFVGPQHCLSFRIKSVENCLGFSTFD